MLALNGRLAAGTPLRQAAGNPAWLTHRDGAFSFRWFDGGIPRTELGIWNVFAAKIGGDAAEPRCEFAGRGASAESGGVLDPSFELEYQGAFPDTVQMYCYALPWQMPYGSSVTTEAPRHGKRAVRIDLTGREEQRLKQRLTGTTMRPGAARKPDRSAAAHPDAPLGGESEHSFPAGTRWHIRLPAAGTAFHGTGKTGELGDPARREGRFRHHLVRRSASGEGAVKGS